MKSLSKNTLSSYDLSGMIMLTLRLVVGWTYFSAFWRRLILENKLIPDETGYIGEKFNHFLPNALGIKPVIEFLVTHPDHLWWAMLLFTIAEGIIGLFIMLGLFTRLMSAGVFMLALGILLGSGWLGTTCLDEWQIGILGIASGFTIALAGGGQFSIDNLIRKRVYLNTTPSWFQWLSMGELPVSSMVLKKISIAGALFIFMLSLFTNQYFHGGVIGKLHNKSVKPHVELSNVSIHGDQLKFMVYRTEGADVYGSFLINIKVTDWNKNSVLERDANALSVFPVTDIKNEYVTKVKPGKHSLIIPLGSKAELTINDNKLSHLTRGTYTLELTDISGIVWKSTINI